MFQLHQQLDQDCVVVGDLSLCRVLLMNDSQYPWIILVPRREAITEIFEMEEGDQQQLVGEVRAVNDMINGLFNPDKMNIAALGNMVPQLHIHCIARFRDDVAWPKPVWGIHEAKAYASEQLAQRVDNIREVLLRSGLIWQ